MLISLQPVEVRHMNPGDKDNRRVLKARVPVDHLSSFETIHSGHAHIHEHEGDVIFQHVFQGFHSRMNLDEVLAQFAQHGFVGQQFARLVVDHQDADLFIHNVSLTDTLCTDS